MSTPDKMPEKTTLVLGGTGRTGRRVVDRLAAHGLPVCVGSRTAAPPFDWDVLGPKSLKGSPVTVHLYVEDVDAAMARAVAAGAKITLAVDDMFWGDRYGKLEDPFGHHWSMATHKRDLTAEEIQAAAAQVGC
jgi:NAD(P)-dependent dehydrogenase (short-subunit alcohol dehydrogenase family)